MAVTEEDRLHLFAKLVEVLGEESAITLMLLLDDCRSRWDPTFHGLCNPSLVHTNN